MRRVREVLRLRHEAGRSQREIGLSCRIGRSTVRDYLVRAEAAGLGWPLPEGLGDEALERLLFPPAAPSRVGRPAPEWAVLHQELRRRKGMTLALLWQEYQSVKSILTHGLEAQPLPPTPPHAPIQHAHLRGAHYYAPEEETPHAASADAG